jgi:hypothetical protein
MSDLQENPEYECLIELDNWIKSQKDAIYERNFKGPNNDSSVLQAYRDELKGFCFKIKRAIWSNDIMLLKNIGLNTKLIECSRDANMRLIMCDRINEWLVTYPNVKNARHLDILLGEQ